MNTTVKILGSFSALLVFCLLNSYNFYMLKEMMFPSKYSGPDGYMGAGTFLLMSFIVIFFVVFLIFVAWLIYFIKIDKHIYILWEFLFVLCSFLLGFGNLIWKESGLERYVDQKIEASKIKNLTYTSEKLGVSFSYVSGYKNVKKITVREVGNKISLYSEDLTELGSVEVFQKDPAISLYELLCKEYPECKFARDSVFAPDGFENIVKIKSKNKCPLDDYQIYLMDRNHSEKYFKMADNKFIPSDKSENARRWYTTMKVL